MSAVGFSRKVERIRSKVREELVKVAEECVGVGCGTIVRDVHVVCHVRRLRETHTGGHLDIKDVCAPVPAVHVWRRTDVAIGSAFESPGAVFRPNPKATDEAPGPPFVHKQSGSVLGELADSTNQKNKDVPAASPMGSRPL